MRSTFSTPPSEAVEIDPRIGRLALGRLLQGFAQVFEADDLVAISRRWANAGAGAPGA
jgi:hypothetical protein